MACRAVCLALVLATAVAVRDTAFIGYSEQSKCLIVLDLGPTIGRIRIKPRHDISPGIVNLIHELATTRACPACKFYRHEPVPEQWGINGMWGPPYSLLQGSLADLTEKPPFEGNPVVKKGDVCIIPGSKEFFIATADHDEWGTAHSVWGKVADEDSWRTIHNVPVAPYTSRTDSGNITTRWLTPETHVPFTLSISQAL